MKRQKVFLTKKKKGVEYHFGYYCDEWLKRRKNQLKDSTFVKYGSVLRRYIKPQFGEYTPGQITSAMIDDFSEKLLYGSGLSPKTVKDILTILYSVVKYAAKQTTGTVPMIDILYPKEVKQERRVLSREEERKFVRFLLAEQDDCKFGILLALMTGLRIGELCALQWGAVSLSERTIRIMSTMQRLQNLEDPAGPRTKIVISTPKTDHSIRTIPMTAYLEMLCRKRGMHSREDYVLTGTGKYMEPRTLQYRLKRYAAACGLNNVHFHTLRHTFATRCVEVGFEIKSLSEILGHSTTKTTMECYVHSSLELKRENMEKLSSIEY